MKSTIYILGILLLTISSNAQSLDFSQNEVSLELNEFLDYDVVIGTNTSQETIVYALRLEKHCQDADDPLGLQVCWGDLCYAPTSDDITVYAIESNLVVLEAGASTGDLSIHQFWIDSYGSDWRLYFYDLNNPSDESFIDIHVGECDAEDVIVSVDQMFSENFQMFPNPADTKLQIQLPEYSDQLKVVIRDLTGKIVFQDQLYSVNNTIDVSEFNDGLYLLTLSKGNTTLRTSRLLID